MTNSATLNELIVRTVEGMGYEFVELERLAQGLLRVTLDSDAPGGVTLEDCERVSNQLSHLFMVEEIPYERLEVSSPGVERPLKRARDWVRFSGELAHVELFAPLLAEGFPEAGRRKLEGRIVACEGESGAEMITFDFFKVSVSRTPSEASLRNRRRQTDNTPPVRVTFPLADVDRAHLIAQLNFKG